MPTITVKKHDLEALLGRKIGLAELEDELMLVKAELDSETKDGEALRDAKGAWIASDENLALRVELNDTNRPDTWTAEGVARQLRDRAAGARRDYPIFHSAASDKRIEVDPRLEAFRPYVGGFLVRGGPIDEDGLLAFIEVQEVLTRNFGKKRATVSIGIYDASSIAFPIQYTSVGRDEVRFEPLPPANNDELDEPFVAGRAMTPGEILAQHPTGREYAGILEGLERVPYLTDAGGQVLSFPPIINSAHIGRVKEGMGELFVEVTGTSLDQCLLALNIMAANFADRGWAVEPVTTSYPFDTPRGREVVAPHLMEQEQRLPVSEVARLLGDDIPAGEVARLLEQYGVKAALDGEVVVATIPSYRADYLHPVDVVEDVAISRGYDSFKPLMPPEFTVGRLDPLTELEDRVRDLMIGFGFEEGICNILMNEDVLRGKTGIGAGEGLEPFQPARLVRIANPMTETYSVLRDTLLPSLLTIEGQSKGARFPHRGFEVGEVCVHAPQAVLGSETLSRCAALIAAEDASFDSAQSVIYALLQALGLDFEVKPWSHPSFIEGRVAKVEVGGEMVGMLGEVHPQVLEGFKIRMPCAVFELTVNALQSAGAKA